ncbi:hypothetical protein P7K49_029705 [Saguinus oedipus]|uniref:Uncharacterized protein n=1 Tax=Saguinus oedipus TaxID=9490 RepID=A0ABQ9U7Z2_SAGOE|nr:hypothetical protein P7K49_029705 [Saguinus oedipus]
MERPPCGDRARAAQTTLGSLRPGCGHRDAGPRAPTLGLRCLRCQQRQPLRLEPASPRALVCNHPANCRPEKGEQKEAAPLLAGRETTGQGYGLGRERLRLRERCCLETAWDAIVWRQEKSRPGKRQERGIGIARDHPREKVIQDEVCQNRQILRELYLKELPTQHVYVLHHVKPPTRSTDHQEAPVLAW